MCNNLMAYHVGRAINKENIDNLVYEYFSGC